MESLMSTEPEEGAAGGPAVGVVGDDVPDPVSEQATGVEAQETPDERQAADEQADGTAEPGRRRRNPLILAGIVLVVIAAILAAVFGFLWYQAAHDDTLAFATTRDKVLQAAETGSINLTTLDYRKVQEGLTRWKESTTGALQSQFTSGSLASTFTKQAQQGKTVTTGTVQDGAVTDLDVHGGKASALIIMRVQVTASGKTTTKLLPLLWGLTNTSTGWKLSAVEQASGQ
jgi:Mce-associated membrane protein